MKWPSCLGMYVKICSKMVSIKSAPYSTGAFVLLATLWCKSTWRGLSYSIYLLQHRLQNCSKFIEDVWQTYVHLPPGSFKFYHPIFSTHEETSKLKHVNTLSVYTQLSQTSGTVILRMDDGDTILLHLTSTLYCTFCCQDANLPGILVNLLLLHWLWWRRFGLLFLGYNIGFWQSLLSMWTKQYSRSPSMEGQATWVM